MHVSFAGAILRQVYGEYTEPLRTRRKLVETLIDDEFYWDEQSGMYQPNGFTDAFEHTGNNRCAQCHRPWSGS